MPTLEFCIGMDYNANINWIVCGQPRGNRQNVLKSFYASNPQLSSSASFLRLNVLSSLN